MSIKKTDGVGASEQAALSFLNQDFNQCFEQMRYYDNQIVSIFRFMFVAYTFLTGAVTSLYKFYEAKAFDLVMPATITLLVALLLGVFIFAIILRNRIYFVLVARYINEMRAHFLALQPLGFSNRTGMYTRLDQPRYFNWLSSQSWMIYIVAFLNSMILFVIGMFSSTWVVFSFLAVLFFLIQLGAAILTLKARK